MAEGLPWGAVLSATTAHRELPPDAEQRLGRFADGLVAAADAALYLAKRHGRDRVERWDPSLPPPGAGDGDGPAAGAPELAALRDLASALAERLRGRARAVAAH